LAGRPGSLRDRTNAASSTAGRAKLASLGHRQPLLETQPGSIGAMRLLQHAVAADGKVGAPDAATLRDGSHAAFESAALNAGELPEGLAGVLQHMVQQLHMLTQVRAWRLIGGWRPGGPRMKQPESQEAVWGIVPGDTLSLTNCQSALLCRALPADCGCHGGAGDPQ
jgi:hypothetical protein